jgi:hypothetical protein
MDLWETMDDTEVPSVTVYLTVIEISKINSSKLIQKTVILPDGSELIVNVGLNVDRNTFSEELSEI